MIHDFKSDLEFSEEASAEPFWEAIYKKAFPNMVNHMLCSSNVTSQHMGIDRIILLSSGKILCIDEKKRRQVWSDILLEYVSNDRTQAPGWIEKDLHIDYLAYAFMPTKCVYLFPWLMLRRAWLIFKKSWLGQYKHIAAQNVGYRTWNVAVPIATLCEAVKLVSIIQL